MFSKSIFFRTQTKKVLYQVGYMWALYPGSITQWYFPEVGTFRFLIVPSGGKGGNAYPGGWGYGGGGGGIRSFLESPVSWRNVVVTSTLQRMTLTSVQVGSASLYAPGIRIASTDLGLPTVTIQGGQHGQPPSSPTNGGTPNGGGQGSNGTAGDPFDSGQLATLNGLFMNRFVAGTAGSGGSANGMFGGGGGGLAGINVTAGLGFPTGLSASSGDGTGGGYAGKGGTGFGSGAGGAQGDYGGESQGGNPAQGVIFVMKIAN